MTVVINMHKTSFIFVTCVMSWLWRCHVSLMHTPQVKCYQTSFCEDFKRWTLYGSHCGDTSFTRQLSVAWFIFLCSVLLVLLLNTSQCTVLYQILLQTVNSQIAFRQILQEIKMDLVGFPNDPCEKRTTLSMLLKGEISAHIIYLIVNWM